MITVSVINLKAVINSDNYFFTGNLKQSFLSAFVSVNRNWDIHLFLLARAVQPVSPWSCFTYISGRQRFNLCPGFYNSGEGDRQIDKNKMQTMHSTCGMYIQKVRVKVVG